MTARVLPFPLTDLAETDEALVLASANGDTAARSALYGRHHRAVFRFCARLNGRTTEDAQDLVQATFLEVFRAAPRFSGNSQVRTWILGIAANLIRHDLRSRTRRARFLTLWGREPEQVTTSLETLTLLREGMGALERALQALPLPMREVFVLCDVEELRGAEAAHALDVPEGTVWRRLHLARKALRAALEEVQP